MEIIIGFAFITVTKMYCSECCQTILFGKQSVKYSKSPLIIQVYL